MRRSTWIFTGSRKRSVLCLSTGELVGYSICFLREHHHDGRLYAINDAIYVVPEYRKGEIAKRLFQYEKIEAACQGADCHTISMKPHKRFGNLLEELGYRPLEITFSQELK